MFFAARSLSPAAVQILCRAADASGIFSAPILRVFTLHYDDQISVKFAAWMPLLADLTATLLKCSHQHLVGAGISPQANRNHFATVNALASLAGSLITLAALLMPRLGGLPGLKAYPSAVIQEIFKACLSWASSASLPAGASLRILASRPVVSVLEVAVRRLLVQGDGQQEGVQLLVQEGEDLASCIAEYCLRVTHNLRASFDMPAASAAHGDEGLRAQPGLEQLLDLLHSPVLDLLAACVPCMPTRHSEWLHGHCQAKAAEGLGLTVSELPANAIKVGPRIFTSQRTCSLVTLAYHHLHAGHCMSLAPWLLNGFPAAAYLTSMYGCRAWSGRLALTPSSKLPVWFSAPGG